MEPIAKEIQAKGIITKTDIPLYDYTVNPHVGCTTAASIAMPAS